MGLILNIDTSLETASVSIAKDGEILASLVNEVQKEHASFLHVAIGQLLKKVAIKPADLDAIAVTEGPGSYTGLRVGMASAKGMSYALGKPFITVGTLEAMALQAIHLSNEDVMYCPLIDARRMEVYTAIYDKELEVLLQPCAMILTEHSFAEQLAKGKIIFSGNGAQKWKSLTSSAHAAFADVKEIAAAISILSEKKFVQEKFTQLAHSEPLYIKEFYNG
ncbi:tRNA (adenosine(37)-N6)-threonylcarbamoyltransferase complex dimerization subunit type 1 TsaB [Ferruginibacter sp. HRS2-29]|uniref:tRNA (adenosine(37)-N6)-threonylcarbamoyltransferase complex dimerization subunit type 1 TsaB n=1 Tax=Ferruginibacter sp. HRS2-29 TaxID=2487334 RepID=UPI0020CE08B1|nr:tRNA (adenosine(37)-N6)-threonylcarbamoyltransferase complex dimerization subunit type 1 TsaB [Ferruginibacter sp. HRS2-29]MCP9752552.1 tRNA (adenosine(37)-N6)-threonylcarbamoyltransferase complex dimerization subunit type 1 TsaB [Ferruginibacter sp. HRS2-29]